MTQVFSPNFVIRPLDQQLLHLAFQSLGFDQRGFRRNRTGCGLSGSIVVRNLLAKHW
jgi:hypothetical protein